MRKFIFGLFASTLMFSATISAAGAEAAVHTAPPAAEEVQQVSKSAAKAMSGSYVTKHNTNVRLDAGTKHKIVLMAKKGTKVTATHQKKSGSQTWYKVKVNGKTGWILSTLLSKSTTKVSKAKAKAAPKAKAKAAPKATAKVAAPKATAKSGTFVTKSNSNIRTDAGTKHKIVLMAKKGTKVTATHQKKSGSQTWYKVKVNGKTGWILSTLLTKSTTKVSAKAAPKAAAPSTAGIVSTAMALRGTPYKYGGSTTAGFDCSGFTQYVYKKNGKNLSRSTLTQFAQTSAVSTPQVGDLVFFANTYRAGISHVGIYIGNNQFVHAGGSKAEVVSLNNSYWGPKFHSFRR